MKKSHPEHISWFLMMSPDVLRRYTSHNMVGPYARARM